MAIVEFDDTQLQRLFAEMDTSTRLKALKGAFRREATKVRKTAVNNLRASGLHVERGMEKGIKASVFKKGAGFRVSSHGAMHTNKRGITKPILIFAEGGTVERHTKGKSLFRRRKKHATGRMRKYGFMEKTLNDVRDNVTNELHNEVTNNVIRTARKYGCI